ncbi:TPA: radical SAM protein [Candidatus Woesearchaeota archaeon]|nr:radical SAM protein [Candidatus Woesearchaeota archaeon]
MAKRAEISLGRLCNNNCVFCLKEEGEPAVVEKEIIFRRLEEFERNGITEVQFTGGEPTIRKDLFDIIDHAKRLGLKVHLQTNGRAFYYKSFAKRVCEQGVESFLISLHAHTPELYERLCGTKGHEQVIVGIRNLLELKQNVVINCVLSKDNIGYAEEIAKHHARLGAEHLQFGWVTPKGRALKNFESVVPKFDESIHHLLKAIDWLDENHKGTLNILGIPQCILGKRSFFKAEEYEGQVILKNGEAKEINRDGALQNKTKPEKCRKCVYDQRCEGLFAEYVKRHGTEEIRPAEEPLLKVLLVAGYHPEKDTDEIPNYGANRVTNELLLALEKSEMIDKVVYIVGADRYRKKKELQNGRVKMCLDSMTQSVAKKYETDVVACYCILRQFSERLKDFGFKKIMLIHSQDAPDILEVYGRYIFEWNKKNSWWISPSEAGKEIAMNIFREFERHKGGNYDHRIKVIPWGIGPVAERKKSPDKIRLLYLGRLDRRYKLDIIPLIKTFRELQKKYPDIELHLAGKMAKWEEKNLGRELTKGIGYYGEIAEKHKMEFIRRHDMLISPVNSIQETFGVTLIEAASQGLDAIGTDWTGYNEILKEEKLIKTKKRTPDVGLPVGKEKFPEFYAVAERIREGIEIDWTDCQKKLEKAIADARDGKRPDPLKHGIKNYLWNNIVKEHEKLWLMRDDQKEDKTRPYIPDLTIPASLFFITTQHRRA